MRYIPLILILLVRTASAATGDIIGASTTNTAGQAYYNPSAQLSLWIQGMPTNGTVTNGFTNFVQVGGGFPYSDTLINGSKIALKLTSQGFDTSGNATTYQRNLWGTILGRAPYPNTNNLNITSNAAGTILSFWLNDSVYSGDSNLTVTVQSNLYGTPPLPMTATNTMIGSATLGSLRQNTSGVDIEYGVFFKPTKDISAVSLGRWVVSGNSGTHTINLRDGGGTLLGSVTVNTSGATSGQFLYANLASPVSLSSGGSYYLTSDEPNGGDQFYDENTTFTFGNSDFSTAGGDVFSAYYLSGVHISTGGTVEFGPVNMKYSTTSLTGPSIANNAVANLTVTNASVAIYPGVVGQWAWPGYELVTNSWTNRYIGFGKFATNFSPVAYAYDVSQDAHGRIVTNHPTLVCNKSYQGNPAIEYESVCSAANFTQGDVITNTFYLYPWVGTAPYVSAPQYTLCDKSNSLTVVVCIADSGNNAMAVVTNLANVAAARLNPAKDIGAACQLINSYNNTHNSFYGASAGLILVRGVTNLLFPSFTDAGNRVKGEAWCTVTPDTGFTRATSVFTNQPSLMGFPNVDLLKFENITLWQTTNYVFFNGSTSNRFWCSDCAFVGFNGVTNTLISGASFINGITNAYWTSCVISNNARQQTIWGNVFVGNRCDRMGTVTPFSGTLSMVGNSLVCDTNNGNDILDVPDGSVVENNSFFKVAGVAIGMGNSVTNGIAIVQNVAERVTNVFDAPIIGAFQPASGNVTNIIFCKNTTTGDRHNWFYYGNTTSPQWIVQTAVCDNLIDSYAMKSDTFSDNSNDYGNWEPFHGVGWKGNATSTTPGNSFIQDFYGPNSMFLGLSYNPGFSAWSFVDDESAFSANGGNGLYRIQSKSSALRIMASWNGIPWGIDGQNRSITDPPGAYPEANPRRGGLMICN